MSKPKLRVIKIGGNVIDDPKALQSFLRSFAQLEEQLLLVHGGGKLATEMGKRLGMEAQLIQGRRITDAATLEVVTMVYGGLTNKQIVAQLQALGKNALGLTGADGNLLHAQKRPVKQIDYGFVGDLDQSKVNVDLLDAFFRENLTPVFAALSHDGQGQILNTNADTIASVLASALAKNFEVELIYCFEQAGVLSDFQQKAVIPLIDRKQYESLKSEKVIHSGMIPKLDNAFEALNSGVHQVRIIHFSDLLNAEAGTKIRL